ncbi:alpha/beta fold hydrolase [Ferrimicrobium sp.]|uniref:alpha/beta fold hydrolase n=1 Tax=Ferrimicrobium sp. TaxID=2926050 RepID=UPI0027E413A9|nr:alpha/beta fold hydrolase [Ferrimicrobium sp.]
MVILLYAGVTDQRSWQEVVSAIGERATVICYDRRGYGETSPSPEEFSHVKDLFAVLDEITDTPVWLVGSSAGGGIALDVTVLAPERVAGLVLFAPSVSGAPDPELDGDTARLVEQLEETISVGDLEEQSRLEAGLWLDGPTQGEGRVGGPVRELFFDMNRVILSRRS